MRPTFCFVMTCALTITVWEFLSIFGLTSWWTISELVTYWRAHHPWSRWLVTFLCLLLAWHLAFQETNLSHGDALDRQTSASGSHDDEHSDGRNGPGGL